MESCRPVRGRRKQILEMRQSLQPDSSSADSGIFSSSSLSSSQESSSSSGYQSSQEPNLKRNPVQWKCQTGKSSLRDKWEGDAGDGDPEQSYEDRRLKNNAAVKRSREKAKKHLDQVLQVIDRLTADNAKLEQNADILRKEAKLIRAMYSAHIRTGHGLVLAEHDLICPDDQTAAAALSQINKE